MPTEERVIRFKTSRTVIERDDATPSDASLGGAIFGALPDFLLAALFAWTWLHPMAFHPLMVKRLVAVITLEFIVVHSAPFAGFIALSGLPTTKRVGALVGLGAIYMLFAWGFAAAFESSWPMVAFFALMLNRVLGVVVGAVPSGAQKTYMGACWVGGAIAYLFGTFATVATNLPTLGITPSVIAAQHFTVGGVWTEAPYRPIALGVLYYSVIGIWQLVALPISLRLSRSI